MDLINDGILWRHIIQQIQNGYTAGHGAKFHIWTDGDMLLVDDESAAETIADFLEIMGFDTCTGYYDPKEDQEGGTVNEYTGWHYISIE